MADLATAIVDLAESADDVPSIKIDQALQIELACEAAGITFTPDGTVTVHHSDGETAGF